MHERPSTRGERETGHGAWSSSESGRFLRATLDALDANIAVLDEAGTIVAVNAAWEAFARDNGMPHGWTGVGESYLEVCDRATGRDAAEAQAAAAGIREVLAKKRGRFLLEYPCHGPRAERWFNLRVTRFADGGPHAVVAHENVSERKRAELAVRRSDRLASVGTLAGGMAHEINNPLGALILAARSAQRHVGEPARVGELLEHIVANAQRCSGIVESLLGCVRSGSSAAGLHDVNESLREVARLLRPWAEQREVELRLRLAEALPPVWAVPDDLRIALFNLGANAIQSCHAGGRVEVRSERARERVVVSVEDDGPGMTEEERVNAFDPFYSKRAGELGTGLGLTLCHSIVSQHGGSIELHSHPGVGTRVSFDLPAA
ncbi:MAG: ATP-binding protein [Myxococcota bacterium]|nr:ATP-binding protein [Myxococcota bacterium]